MIGFFIVVLLIQVLGITFLKTTGNLEELPFEGLVLVPVLILGIILDEVFILRYLKKAEKGEKKFRDNFKYMVSILEISYPSIVLFFGAGFLINSDTPISTFMFFSSPPFLVYFIVIALTAFYLEFKISLITGIVGVIQYAIISLLLMDVNSLESTVSLSKLPFILAAGVITGLVGKRLRDSVVSSLEAKNTLINELDRKVAERTAKIEDQKEELAKQNNLLQERNQEITDSIVYAQRIQNAILPPDQFIKEHLPQSFVLYKPKDIVAGDFYWLEEKEGVILFAAADCTGHGVPGAMVSVICNNGLNRSVREYGLSDPGKILDKTREIVIQEFAKSKDEVKDGMDIALCALQPITSTPSDSPSHSLKYAGAHNPLWIIRNGSDEIEEIKADKQPIGKFDHSDPYNTHEVKLNKGDTVYVFSDGYADQFGGEKGKKYKAANFKKLLLSVCDKPVPEQSRIIDRAFEDWKGNLEQLDDVCVIGVRI
ncbi:MAG: SpoIIE family protein phosphatase [Crocinitomicaceae bacterium]|nr:SpoIIE family protein phosphatase [Crocinitomicaceae bacterium]